MSTIKPILILNDQSSLQYLGQLGTETHKNDEDYAKCSTHHLYAKLNGVF